MPYMKKVNGKSVRNYRVEYDKYHSRPEQIKNRTQRTTARRQAEADGLVSKGDGQDVDHRQALSRGGSNSKSNQRVVDSSANRSFRRNPDGSMKSQTSTRERSRRK